MPTWPARLNISVRCAGAGTGQCARRTGTLRPALWRNNYSSSSESKHSVTSWSWGARKSNPNPGSIDEHKKLRDESEIYSLNPAQDAKFKEMIDACGKDGDTLGGIIEVRVEGLPFGLGSHTQWGSETRRPVGAGGDVDPSD